MKEMTRKTLGMSVTLCLLWCAMAQAMPLTLTNEYQVTASTMNVGLATWQFTYQVTNVNQGVPGQPEGLCGFAIQIPDSATVMWWTVPSRGSWAVPGDPSGILGQHGWTAPDPDYHWMLWWAFGTPAVYPPGSTATFSVTLSNVSLGWNDGGLATYWHLDVPGVEYYTVPPYGNYTRYLTELVSPAPVVPAPGAILLGSLGAGLVGWLRRRRTL